MSQWPYRPGDHLIVCDTCGKRFYRSQCKKDWQGFIVCQSCFDPRHPQELLQVRKDRITVTDPRPEGADVFLNLGDVNAEDL